MYRSTLAAAAEASLRAVPSQNDGDASAADARQRSASSCSVSVSIASNSTPPTRWRENMLGVDVEFPYNPYPQQIVLMQKIVECVLHGKHGLLESPTGTGKTLCLLCATLAAQQHQHQLQLQQLPIQQQPQGKVIYASRTHAQLQQVVRELRKTSFGGGCIDGVSYRTSGPSTLNSGDYRQSREHRAERSVPGWSALQPHSTEPARIVSSPARGKTSTSSSRTHPPFDAAAIQSPPRQRTGISIDGSSVKNRARVCLLGSRDHFCVDRSLSHLKGFALNRACKQKVKSQRCIYYAGSQRNKDEVFAKLENGGLFDIEDLHVQAHQAPIFCPYYSMLDYQARSNIILTPFSNLFDSAGGGGIASEAFRNAALVIDEAHNIERVAEDSCGFELRQADVGRCLAALQQAGVLLCQEQPQEQQRVRPRVDIEKVYTLTLGLKALDEWMEKAAGTLWMLQLTLSDPKGEFNVPHRLLRLFEFAPKAESLQRQAAVAAASIGRSGDLCGALKGNFGASIPTGFASLKKSKPETVRPAENCVADTAEKPLPATDSFFGCIEVLLEGSPETDAIKNPLQDEAMKLDELRRCCKVLFNDTTVLNEESFWIYIHQEKIKLDFFDVEDTAHNDSQQDNVRTHRTLVFLCMTPAPAFQSLVTKNVRSVILASGKKLRPERILPWRPAFLSGSSAKSSLEVNALLGFAGTLSPLLPLARRMSSPSFSISVVWANSHIIAASQCRTLVVNSASSSFDLFNKASAHLSAETEEQLLGTFQNRKSVAYLSALANTVCRLSMGVFGGVLVFFPSYTLMDSFLEFLNKGNQTSGASPWNTLLQSSKQIFVEPKKGQALSDVLQAFQRAIDEDLRREGAKEGTSGLSGNASAPSGTAGAVLFGVAKGKIAEGLDLGDWYCRLVIVVGLPYASTSDPRVTLKKMFLDRQRAMALNRKDAELPPSGQEWYRQEAMRAVNQAVGRVVRHSDDFGLVALADSRFTQHAMQADLSAWVRAGLTKGASVVSAAAAGTVAAEFFESVPPQLVSKALNKINKVVGIFLNRQIFSWQNVAAAAIAAAGGTNTVFAQSCCSRLLQRENGSGDSQVSQKPLIAQKLNLNQGLSGASESPKQFTGAASAAAIAAAARKSMLLRGTQAVGGTSKKVKKGGTFGALVSLTNAAVGFKPKPSTVLRSQFSVEATREGPSEAAEVPGKGQTRAREPPALTESEDANSAPQAGIRNSNAREVEKAKETGRQLLRQLRTYLGPSYSPFCSLMKKIPEICKAHTGVTGKSTHRDSEAGMSLIRGMCQLLLDPVKRTSLNVHSEQDSWITLCESVQKRTELLHQIIQNYFGNPFENLHDFVDGYADDILRSAGGHDTTTDPDALAETENSSVYKASEALRDTSSDAGVCVEIEGENIGIRPSRDQGQ